MAVTGKTAIIERALNAHLLALNPDGWVLSTGAWGEGIWIDGVSWSFEGTAVRIANIGATFEPVVGEIYLQPTTLWNASDRDEIGPEAGRRHLGIFQVMVRGAAKGNPEPQTEVADAIIEHFDRASFERHAVTVNIGSFNGGRAVPWRSTALVDGGWRLIPVSIPFWSDTYPS